ncbi:hypothetical protein Adt_04328 [Abeliophyllum distichum]|uniref:Uncharacterized protein n=1 Tax=Abeliophyllum distichum TaxID=126358 RepID=A0ABD1W4E6_9LAMI
MDCRNGLACLTKILSGGTILVHPFQATRKKKTSLLNTIPSTRLLNKVQNLVEKNSVTVHSKEDTHSYSCADSLKKWMNDSGAVLSQQCSTSPSISITFGKKDTESDFSLEKLPARTIKVDEHKVIDKMPEPEVGNRARTTVDGGRSTVCGWQRFLLSGIVRRNSSYWRR